MPVSLRVGAGHQRRAARIGVRRVGGLRVGVFGAAGGQPRELRVGMVGDVPVQIGLVHAVDRDQEHVLDLSVAVRTSQCRSKVGAIIPIKPRMDAAPATKARRSTACFMFPSGLVVRDPWFNEARD